MERRELYSHELQPVTFWGETLFRTLLPFPKTIERGWYVAEVYLINDGMVTAMQATPIEVRKIGVEAAIYDLAHRHGMVYGLLSVALALAAGWGGSKLFGRIR